MNIEQLKGLFTNPSAEYRSVPFWSWNDDLQQEELDRQVEGFKQQGMGGFMMHVREGLETPYLGEEFFERIRETVQTAKREGMYAWLYDEDRYSSGMGEGLFRSLAEMMFVPKPSRWRRHYTMLPTIKSLLYMK